MTYQVRFIERRPNGRTRPMKVQRVGPVESVAQVWAWVATIITGSTPDVLSRLQKVEVTPDAVPATPAVPA